MKRLNQNNLNYPELAIKEWEGRWKKELHYIDWARYWDMAKYFKGGRFLDLGVFNSPLIIELKRRFKDSEFIGLDHCQKVMMELQERHPEVRYLTGDVSAIPFKDDYFDYVVAGELIEHLEDPVAFIKEVMRVLKKGGVFSLSTPKEESEERFVSHEHLWSFNEQDMNNLLKPYGKIEISTMKISLTEQFICHLQKK